MPAERQYSKILFISFTAGKSNRIIDKCCYALITPVLCKNNVRLRFYAGRQQVMSATN